MLTEERFAWSRPALTTSTDREREVRRVFGLGARDEGAVPVLTGVSLSPVGITYVTGFSGSGKSQLLRLARERWPHFREQAIPPSDRSLVEALGLELDESMSLLGRVGLGEVFQFLTPYDRLSDGQQARARLAYTFARGARALIIDEFLSTLDRVTARAVAFAFQRFCRPNGIAAIVATAHDDLVDVLGPDRLVRLDFNGTHVTAEAGQPIRPFDADVRVRRGTAAELAHLERFHYMGCLGAVDTAYDLDVFAAELDGEVVGVSAFMAPYPRVWNAKPMIGEINRRLRLLVRVIVHPAFRGIGLTSRLVDGGLVAGRAVYLRTALGLYQPFVESAGYLPVAVPEQEVARTACVAGDPDRARDVAADMLHAEFLSYVRMLDLDESPGIGDALESYRRLWSARVGRISPDDLFAQVTPFDMAGFLLPSAPKEPLCPILSSR